MEECVRERSRARCCLVKVWKDIQDIYEGDFSMRYDFSKMSADTFELMVRSLNERIFGIRCEQYGLGADGQREFVFEGNVKDSAGVEFRGRTIGQVKYKYITTKEDDYTWLVKAIDGELRRFRKKDAAYLPDNYLFYTNIVLTPAKDTGIKDKIEAYIRAHNDIIKHFYVRGYDEICAMLDNNRDVAISYAATILPGDLLVRALEKYEIDYFDTLKRFLFCEFEEEMYPRLEQAGSVTEKKIPIEKVCVDINVMNRQQIRSVKFAEMVFSLGNQILGYRGINLVDELKREENFVLIGGPGKGKSTISQFIAQIYRAYDLQAFGYRDKILKKFIGEFEKSYDYRIDRVRIPFKVVLREYAAWIIRREKEENQSIIQYMQERINKFAGNELPMDTLRRMLREQAWIFFFDGLDEVPESSNRQEVLRQIRRFIITELREAQCDCMIIGTTREQGYSNDFDEEKYLHMEVAELSEEDSRMYIHKLFEVMEEQTERREQYIHIMYEALEDEITGRLMKTPLQVTIIAILVKSGGRPPHERYSLFRQYYDTMVKREKQKGIVATLNDNMDWLEEIHYLVGYRLQSESEMEGNASAEISRDELKKEIRNYVEKNRDDFYETEDEDQEKETKFFMTITQRICFLNENKDGVYSFTIRSMQEYFAGTYLIKGRSDKEALKNIEMTAYKSYWRNALLFALGYIELERKSLEPEIGLLCGQMNGQDNLTRNEYTSDNLCLFGSWLAVDILIENIFRGRPQTKYIRLAAEAIGLVGCANYNKFSSITGIQKDKLVSYVKEEYEENPEGIIKAARLYLKLDENEKNDLEHEIARVRNLVTERQALAIDVNILRNGTCSIAVQYEAVDRTMAALEQGKISDFLPEQVLEEVLYSFDKEDSMELKRNIFLQCLYSGNKHLGWRDLENCLEMQCDVELMIEILKPWNRDILMHKTAKDLTKSIKIDLYDTGIAAAFLSDIQKELQNMNLIYLAEFCGFLLDPTFAKYQDLCRKAEEEEKFLAEKYQRLLKSYVRHEPVSEEEFDRMERERKKEQKYFMQGDFDKLCYKDLNVSIIFFYRFYGNKFSELMNCEKIPFDNLGKLNDDFFDTYMYAATEETRAKNDILDEDENSADGMIRLIYETVRRKKYRHEENRVIAALAGSRFKGNLWKQIPDFLLVDEMLEIEYTYSRNSKIQTEVLEKAIGSIISKLVCDGKESNYLSIIPTWINESIDIKKCISENDMRELEQLEYSVGANLLTMKLLRMCMNENEMPGELLEDLLRCDVPREIVYWELEKVLRYCTVKNKEKIWVEMYLKLEKDDFDRSWKIKEGIINDMIEAKSKAVPSSRGQFLADRNP